MVRFLRRKSWMAGAMGVMVGLAIGGALSAGIWLGRADSPMAASLPSLSELKLRAAATHGAETFAIATGNVDSGVEGLFTLDFLTGELQCFVINPRTGGVGGNFKTNIARDLTPEKGKKPSYLIVTGEYTSQTGTAGNYKPAGCICYVVDANTGEVATYTFPWSKPQMAAGTPQSGDMKLIYKWKARALELRDQ